MQRVYLIFITVFVSSLAISGVAGASGDPPAPLGSIEALEEFVEWLLLLGEELIRIFVDAMDLLGLSEERYAKEMIQSLEEGLALAHTTKTSK
ncbi:MAG: hypothetical protein D5R99_00575 [Methanocalculus sp. MSAO_Arc1]|uniref:hypothetical protein n=1 Tax=Methanocalculus TaxID=71151 RepID=UPI000FF846B3|nr:MULTISPECIES: hypothetical protein [unclassified Methanocalculus]MCP1661631.1 hypothetical protein [Methanocalculus sp. AMF5]RQD81893.1 MAG: hypothetical protein D5R99_00575 [Methanocalculus sp. MSAO_Arc1]